MAQPEKIKSVAVYCSSSNTVHADYLACARDLGTRLARSGRELIYGGGRVGLMGETARACREGGGRVVGVITERLAGLEQMDSANHENIVVATMRERKRLIEQRCQAMVVLPGGLGTMEEFFEVLVGRLLGEHHKPIMLLNCVDPNHAPNPATMPLGRAGALPAQPEASIRGPGFYDPLLSMIDHMIESKFAKAGIRGLFEVCRSAGEAMAAIDRFEREGAAPADASLLTPSAKE